ncbi:glycogen/starch/alpha-glucan phosphorylase, partial [Pseudomonas aeruginosa]
SHQINGVSALHTELMRETVFHDLHRLYPQRISNKTNGVSFRRWLFQANPGLTELLVETLGADLLDTPERRLPDLEEHVEDARLRAR